jgi:hypothetical protein
VLNALTLLRIESSARPQPTHPHAPIRRQRSAAASFTPPPPA